MKKIPTIFMRDPENMRLVTDQPHPDCHWVFHGEGVATRKYDGTCVMIDENGCYYKRREVKKGKGAPDEFAETDFDETTGKRVGWVPVTPSSPEDKWHREAFDNENSVFPLHAGTYELCGPKVQKNHENFQNHTLVKHADAEQLPDAPRTFEALPKWLKDKDVEGIVWHHPDGRMAKIKKRDFGLPRVEGP